jgi:hypothetical protein
MEFTTAGTDGIVSSAVASGKNRVLLNGVNMRRPDGTTKLINKTGSAPYLFSNCIRSVTADTIVGTPGLLGTDTVDQRVGIVNNATASFTLSYNQHMVVATSAAIRAITLPPGIVGKEYVIKDGASSANVTITPDGAETIDGNSTFIIDQDFGALRIVWNGNTWAVTHEPAAGSVPDYEEFVATAAQTVFNPALSTVAKAAGKAYLQVFVNGVFQMEGATKAFTVTGANQLTFNAGLALNDDVAIYSFA